MSGGAWGRRRVCQVSVADTEVFGGGRRAVAEGGGRPGNGPYAAGSAIVKEAASQFQLRMSSRDYTLMKNARADESRIIRWRVRWNQGVSST